jgi:hypothetical protein
MLALLRSLLERILTLREDLTRTYRPVKDWAVPLERILEELQPEALEPVGERRECCCRSKKGGKK